MNEYDKRRSEAGAGGEPDLFSPVQYSRNDEEMFFLEW